MPFRHAVAAVDGSGEVIWSQGELDAVFPLASVTKIVTAMSTLVAVQEGLLDLSSQVGVSTIPAGPRGLGQPFSVAHLLSHSSGLAAEGDGTRFKDQPGRRRIYSNQGFEVLGDYLQSHLDRAVIGVGLPKWFDRTIFAPLGMRATVIPRSPARSGFGNAIDLTLLVEELLEPQLLTAKTHGALISVALPGLRGILPGYGMQKANDWGLGVEIKAGKRPHWTPPQASPKTFGHFGMSGSFVWVDPVAGIGAVFVGERPFGDWHKENWPILGSRILQAASDR